MSGGVDSSVVAALLKEQGYDVVGVTLQLYDQGAAAHRKGACCAGQDIQDARQVAARLDIPHYVLDYEQRFREKVIDRFAQSYVDGETPVPCVACNSDIKFADFLDTARELGADVLATGHYIAARPDGAGGRALFRARDTARDQSYFLFATTPEQLKSLRFPLGELEKTEVRAIARRHGLLVADKADSQDICFVQSGKYSRLIEQMRPDAARPGEIVHIDGRILGRHSGVINFTVGQRRGLGISFQDNGAAIPLYVVRLDAAHARVIVGPREALATRRVKLRDLNWIGGGTVSEIGAETRDVFVRARSTKPPVAGSLNVVAGVASVAFASHEDGVSPGQACALYDSDRTDARILGGGFICEAESDVSVQSRVDLGASLTAADG
jgi:tRNA-specific 2-thiouridylase